MEEAAEDRISNLPDPLLHHIISFLEIKDAAGTSVLSKRWNYIWTTVPTLDFQIQVFESAEKFMDFVDGTLRRHSSNVDKFAVNCLQPLNESRVHSWVSNVIRSKVKELELCIHPFFLPQSLFTCESLISLELGNTYSSSFAFPKYISLPRLKRLNLSSFKFSDECWNGELFSNSPVLEELVLQFCEFHESSFSILIPTLKLLDIRVSGGEEIDCVFKIDAPRLITFSYSGYVAKEFVLSSFPSLVEATANIYFEGNDGAEQISRLLRALAHAKCLTVSDKTLQAICSTSYLSNKLLTFHNVKNLNISDRLSLTADEKIIALLTAVPNLESLIFSEYMHHEEQVDNDEDNVHGSEEDNVNDSEDEEDDNGGDGDCADAPECGSNDEHEDNYGNQDNSWVFGSVTDGCLFSCLKSVCFRRFAGNPRELRWVKLILTNAKALQNMNIRYRTTLLRFANPGGEKELRLSVRIPSFPRRGYLLSISVVAIERPKRKRNKKAKAKDKVQQRTQVEK